MSAEISNLIGVGSFFLGTSGLCAGVWIRGKLIETRRAKAEAQAAENQAKAMDSIQRMNEELGRKIASGSSLADAFKSVQELHDATCKNPNCIRSKHNPLGGHHHG